MSVLTLYMKLRSPPCWEVFLIAEALDLRLNLSFIDLQGGQHMAYHLLTVTLNFSLCYYLFFDRLEYNKKR